MMRETLEKMKGFTKGEKIVTFTLAVIFVFLLPTLIFFLLKGALLIFGITINFMQFVAMLIILWIVKIIYKAL